MTWTLPSGWSLKTLDELAGPNGVVCDGDWVESKDQDPSGAVRLLQLADIGDGAFLDKSARFLTQDKAAKLRCTYLNEGDVLIARMASPLGRAIVYPGGTKPAVTVVDVCIWRADHDGVDPRWLMHTINAPQTRQQIAGQSSGTTRQRIAGGKLKQVLVPVPPPAEQRRIAARIDELFAEIAEGEAALARARQGLDTWRRSLLKAAVTGELTSDWRARNDRLVTAASYLEGLSNDSPAPHAMRRRQNSKLSAPSDQDRLLGRLPEGWTSCRLSDLGTVTGGLTKNPKRNGFPRSLPFLRVANVQMGRLDLAEIKSIGVQASEEQRLLLQKYDLLIVEGNGSVDQIGRCAIWDEQIPSCVHQNHIIKVRFPRPWLAYWCLVWLLSPKGREAIKAVASSTSGLHTLSISKIQNLPLPLPPAKEGRAALALLKEFELIDGECEQQLAGVAGTNTILRQSVLKAAFEGKLFDEDASEKVVADLPPRNDTVLNIVGAGRQKRSPRVA